MFKLIVPNMVSHTDSNREPTYYKSADEGISSRIMYDSKRLLSHPSNKIINSVNGINRVVYDVTSKPPSTIELE